MLEINVVMPVEHDPKILDRMNECYPLSINTYGGTEIPVFRRRVAGMIERAVLIISIIKK